MVGGAEFHGSGDMSGATHTRHTANVRILDREGTFASLAGGYSARTVRSIASTASLAFGDAVRWGHLLERTGPVVAHSVGGSGRHRRASGTLTIARTVTRARSSGELGSFELARVRADAPLFPAARNAERPAPYHVLAERYAHTLLRDLPDFACGLVDVQRILRRDATPGEHHKRERNTRSAAHHTARNSD